MALKKHANNTKYLTRLQDEARKIANSANWPQWLFPTMAHYVQAHQIITETYPNENV